MRRSKFKISTATLVIGGLLTLGILSEPALSGTFSEDLREGLPGRRISGGSRSPNTTCRADSNQPVVALIPENTLGLTLTDRPTLWFSLPAISPDRSLEFGLFNQAGELLYQKSLKPPAEAGLTHLTLPETDEPLQAEQDYRWYLSVVCNPESRSEDLFVTGWIRRVQPTHDIEQQLATGTQQEHLALYKEKNAWLDALTTLCKLRREDPTDTDLSQDWNSLLAAVNLTQASTKPIGELLEYRIDPHGAHMP